MIALKKYLSLVKFSHTIFAMPFALVGFFLGIKALSKIPHIKVFEPWKLSVTQKTKLFFQGNLWIFLLVILCMVFARSAAMAFNRWLDKNFDAKNPRTSIREIPAGIIKSNSALWFVIICSLLFVICCYFINNICFFLSPVALFVVLFYSYTKRFTALCHLVLGVGLSLAPIGAYLAVTGQFELDQRLVRVAARHLEIHRPAPVVDFAVNVVEGGKPCQAIHDLQVLLALDRLALQVKQAIAVFILDDVLQEQHTPQ